LKPDVCRRVVGRLPSPHIQISLQKLFWSTARDGATIQPPPCSEEQVEVHGGLSCEIVSDLCPNPFSHDWHVQPSCQRPNRLPPERRAFSSRRTRCKQRIRLSSKPFKHIVRAKPCQHSHPTVFPRVFHIGNLLRTRRRGAQKLKTARNDIAFRSGFLQRRRFLSACRSGRQKIEKRS
jgi:hypothetical protein